jgi:integrase
MASVRKEKGTEKFIVDLRPAGKQIWRNPDTEQPFSSKKEAHSYLQKFMANMNNGFDLTIGRKKTFRDAQVAYLEWIKIRLDTNTLGRGTYDNYVKDAEDALTMEYNGKSIADIPLQKIKASELKHKTVYDFLTRYDSYKTAKEKWQRFKKIFQIAAEKDWLAASPAATLSLPKEPDDEELEIDQEADEFDNIAQRISREAVAKIIDAAKYENFIPQVSSDSRLTINPQMWYVLIMFAAYTGMRFGEQSALLWSSIDFEKNIIHVRRAQKKYGKVGKPKSKAGKRAIPLLPSLKAELLKWKLMQSEREARNNLVFANIYGGLAGHDLWTRSTLERICRQNKLPKIRWHDLRHHFVSVMIFDVDVPATTITKMIGHASVDFTVKQYAKWLEDRDRDLDIANKMEAAFLKRLAEGQ